MLRNDITDLIRTLRIYSQGLPSDRRGRLAHDKVGFEYVGRPLVAFELQHPVQRFKGLDPELFAGNADGCKGRPRQKSKENIVNPDDRDIVRHPHS